MLPLSLLFPLAQVVPAQPAPNPPSPQVAPPELELPPVQSLPPKEVLPVNEPLPPLEALSPIEVVLPAEVRPLAGSLDTVPVFNSNSPEVVLKEGILLSTFPGEGMRYPEAHLNFAFEGRFDIFSHHIARARSPEDTRTLIQGVVIYNPSDQPVTLEVLESATYLTRPDALFIELPAQLEDPLGSVYAGPGSRVVNDVLRGRQRDFPPAIVLAPGESRMLMELPIPVGNLVPSSNGRSALIRLQSDGPVYLANLAMFAPLQENGRERLPTLEEWLSLLIGADVSGPRDLTPTPLDGSRLSQVVYGRVAGVAEGSRWSGMQTDNPNVNHLTIPAPNGAIAYGLSTLHRGRLGTGQIQTARMLARYPDTAYYAHGNYGIEYNLLLPLYNPTNTPRKVAIALSTPVKDDETQGGLVFFKPPENRVFFRGTVRLRYPNGTEELETRYLHLVQYRGQRGEPLLVLDLAPGERRIVHVDMIYPPDSTPPQALVIQTLATP